MLQWKPEPACKNIYGDLKKDDGRPLAGIPVGVQNKKVILKKDGGRPGWRSSGNSNRRAKQKKGILKKMADWTGLEPATPGVTGRYSNQLNYQSALCA